MVVHDCECVRANDLLRGSAGEESSVHMVKGAPPPADPAGMDPTVVAAVAIALLTTVALAFFFLSGGKKAKFLNKERQQLVLGVCSLRNSRAPADLPQEARRVACKA